jgi:hypothetical protein
MHITDQRWQLQAYLVVLAFTLGRRYCWDHHIR